VKSFLSAYKPNFVTTIVYMLQQTEYRTRYYLKWLWRTHDFARVQTRGRLDMTTAAKALVFGAWALTFFVVAIGAYLVYYGLNSGDNTFLAFVGLFAIFSLPFVVAHLLLIPTWLGKFFIITPMRGRQDVIAHGIFTSHKWKKIAVAGSFGKTTMKQILATVLGEGKKVAFTEANLNTSVAHYRFAKSLTGKEEVLIVEYGEYVPGDISGFNTTFRPDIGIITGLNEAHLENFGTLEASADNILSLAEFVGEAGTYINGDSEKLVMRSPNEATTYNNKEVDGWKISSIRVNTQKTSFTMKKANKTIKASSSLVGKHNVGPLAMAAALASNLGLDKKQIESGLAKTEPYEHRMKPEMRKGHVLVIDDTYNGNIDGVRVGVEFLSDINAKRKIYVTPGLVEQGKRSQAVHQELGQLVGKVADMVVLMKNSATEDIKVGLKKSKFKGKLMEIDDPLHFYTNLDQITVSGDVVLMQNDWTDAYH